MSEELFYTSAPSGLKIGSRDYCTVARTQSMSTELADDLEGLSGYRILFMPRDPNAAKNPVVWSHLRILFEGRLVSVLSRIGASGLDYTGRTNKFAHHVALNDAERPLGGPAWLLSQPRFMIPAWDGQVRLIPSGRITPQGDSSPGVAQAWRSATGDPGWAGVLAESFLSDPKRLVYIVFRPGMELLPLFVEAEALLPPEKRWEVAFNTYYTNLPSAVSCPWLGIVTDSPEIAEARRMTRSLIIDLTQPLGTARGGSLVDQARTGVRVAPRPMPPPQRPIPSVDTHAPDPAARSLKGFPAGAENPATRGRSPESYPLATGASPPPLVRASSGSPSRPKERSRKRTSIVPLALASSALGFLLLTIGIVVGTKVFSPPPQGGSDPAPVEYSPTTASIIPPEPTPEPSKKRLRPIGILMDKTQRDRHREAIKKSWKKMSKRLGDARTEAKDKAARSFSSAPKQIIVPLPLLDPDGRKKKFPLLDELPVGLDVSLSVLGLQENENKGPHLEVESTSILGKSNSTKIVFNPESSIQSPSPVAEFSIEDHKLFFAWDPKLKESDATIVRSLRDCALEVRVDGKLWRTIGFRDPLQHPKPLGLDEPRKLRWDGEEAPIRALSFLKCQLVPKPATLPNPTPRHQPQQSDNGGSYALRFEMSKGEPLTLSVNLKQESAGTWQLATKFSPGLADLNQDQRKEIGSKLRKMREELSVLAESIEQKPSRTRMEMLLREQTKLKEKEEELSARNFELQERIDLIDKLKKDFQLKVTIGFKLRDEEFIAATLGDDGANP